MFFHFNSLDYIYAPIRPLGTFPHGVGERGSSEYFVFPLLPFMGEMASGQRGRYLKNIFKLEIKFKNTYSYNNITQQAGL